MSIQTSNRAYTVRLLLNKEQQVLFAKISGSVCFIWNKLLTYSSAFYKEHGKPSFTTLTHCKEHFPWLKEVDGLALTDVQLNLKRVYKDFVAKNNQFFLCGTSNYIHFPKMSFVQFMQYRHSKEGEKIKEYTITKIALGKYYQRILVKDISKQKLIQGSCDAILGCDSSMTYLYRSNNGKKAHYPCYHCNTLTGFVKRNQCFALKIKRRSNWYKIRLKRARFHKRITKHLDICTSDNGWSRFVNMFVYKLTDKGKQLMKLNTWFALSKLYSVGERKKENLVSSERVHRAEQCDYTQGKDFNAAQNNGPTRRA